MAEGRDCRRAVTGAVKVLAFGHLSLVLCHGWRARRAKEKSKSMEQCSRERAGKHRVLSAALFHDCSTEDVRGVRRTLNDERRRRAAGCWPQAVGSGPSFVFAIRLRKWAH